MSIYPDEGPEINALTAQDDRDDTEAAVLRACLRGCSDGAQYNAWAHELRVIEARQYERNKLIARLRREAK